MLLLRADLKAPANGRIQAHKNALTHERGRGLLKSAGMHSSRSDGPTLGSFYRTARRTIGCRHRRNSAQCTDPNGKAAKRDDYPVTFVSKFKDCKSQGKVLCCNSSVNTAVTTQQLSSQHAESCEYKSGVHLSDDARQASG